jgi:hypothetical protein
MRALRPAGGRTGLPQLNFAHAVENVTPEYPTAFNGTVVATSPNRLEIGMSKKPQKPKMKHPEQAVTEEAIGVRAYEKWQQRGQPLWDQEQDWFNARAELEQELAAIGTRSGSEKT